MKQIKRTLALLLALTVLVSSGGVFVMIHTCLSAKKTEVSLSGEHKCCSSEKSDSNQCNINMKCCKVDFQYHKLNIVSLNSEKTILVDIILPVFHLDIFKQEQIQKISVSIQTDPPLLIQDFSISFGQLLI